MSKNAVVKLIAAGLLLASTTSIQAQSPPTLAPAPVTSKGVPAEAGPGEIGLWGEVASFDATLGSLQLRAHGFQLPNGRRAAFAEPKLKEVRLSIGTVATAAETAIEQPGAVKYGQWVFVIGRDEGAGVPLTARSLYNYGTSQPAIVAPILQDAPAQPLAPVIGVPKIIASRKYVDHGRYASFVVRRFPLKNYSLSVSYKAKGESAGQVLKKGEAVYAFGGGYFEPGSKRSIDYIVIGGKEVDDYRWDWSRPVITVHKGTVSIVRPKKKQDIRGKFDFAVAVDHKATNRSSVVGRQIFGLTKTEMIFVRCYSTEAASRRTMAKLGVTNYVFLDGGSSTPPSARIPTRLVVVPRG